jgi:hypothetical protein
MTYLDWGCDPLEEECESCLDALCNACNEEFKKNAVTNKIPEGAGGMDQDAGEPDCDNCELEKKPDCSRCEIILDVCKNCSGNKTCEFRICGPG